MRYLKILLKTNCVNFRALSLEKSSRRLEARLEADLIILALKLSMADYLASIHGTEKDRINCSFFYKIGSCRHGKQCERKHNIPLFSQTVLFNNLYINPTHVVVTPEGIVVTPMPPKQMTEREIQQDFDEFYTELFNELSDNFGDVEEIHACDNLCEHLIGNTYVKFRDEDDAKKCVEAMQNRWFNGKPIHCDLSPVTDFREACCRQHDQGECTRAGFCNFMHLKSVSQSVADQLKRRQRMIRKLLRKQSGEDSEYSDRNSRPGQDRSRESSHHRRHRHRSRSRSSERKHRKRRD